MPRARPPMSSNLAIRLRQNFALVTAIVLFCVVYLFYHLSHPKGFSSAVLVQNGDEVFTLAMVAMAQTVPVLMAGLPINRPKIVAFPLGGFFAGCGGLFLAIQPSSGNADLPQAGTYTLNSI